MDIMKDKIRHALSELDILATEVQIDQWLDY
ncbi:16S rRNA (guanine(527)-N(7))-methyltransferase RsmG, partial [Francisella tularensis subsp. holarctica]|nr:16S rRNA (guanine(527)-N(7))-methyltransferase RsmG [Francisella tularensis subsp. holarctica]